MNASMCPLSGWNESDNGTREKLWELLVEEEEREALYKLPAFILLFVLMVVGLPGNILTLLVYGFRFPASTTKSFIMAMAVFDIINCALGMPFEMVDLRYDMELDIHVICEIIRFWVSLSACGSVTVLVAVSVDRFRRICQPFRKQMTVKHSRIVILVLTLVSVIFASPALVLYGTQTENRFGMDLHDCSINDEYKNGRFSSVYQYILAGTWIVSIVVLVIMYSFIIYNIRLQKQRRDKLSSQSHDSAVLTKLHALAKVAGALETKKQNLGPSSECSFGGSCDPGPTSNGSKKSDDQSSVICGSESGYRDSNSIKQPMRLFSRDVNPIFEDEQISNKFCDIDGISLPDTSFRAGSTNLTTVSLNNYLSASQDTSFISRSTSTVHADKPKISVAVCSQETVQARTRKYGHSFGRYHPWESEKFLRQVSDLNSDSSREKKCRSQPVKEAAISLKCGLQIRHASSLPSLQLSEKSPECHQNNNNHCNQEDQSNHQTHLRTNDTSILEFNSQHHQNDTRPGVFHSQHHQNDTSPGVLDSKVSSSIQAQNNSHLNVTWDYSDSSQCQTELNKGETNSRTDNSKSVGLKPPNTTKSGSINIFIQMKKKKSSIREVKTSKVSLMMLMVTVGFILSYLPHLCIQILKGIFSSYVERLLCTNQAYFVVHHLLLRSFFINNAINPIIYSFYNKTFRERCLRLLKSPKSLLQSSNYHIGSGPSVSQDNDTS